MVQLLFTALSRENLAPLDLLSKILLQVESLNNRQSMTGAADRWPRIRAPEAELLAEIAPQGGVPKRGHSN